MQIYAKQIITNVNTYIYRTWIKNKQVKIKEIEGLYQREVAKETLFTHLTHNRTDQGSK